ncbi:CRISPR-associated RAMP, Csx10 family [Pseudanabaena sp. lw0831]|uniref:type III-D CRISPR-associated RAMP protein Csx10 n=1 Tax=Pseudanabaena sp. lw0831 TaxID=1357935 RepID=UPI001916B670|nr:CRISPR-associated RAMP protein Csx10 [Pseudanabaena sp. lw0831]GBO53386.1 CRISPR-associated RAMP, Csx10 family [Pseudanabaena sp. lw0831]
MKRINLEIKAVSPLAIGRQKPGGSVSEADEYISGTVIRGAIASQILQQSGRSSEDLSQNGGDFQQLFLSDRPAIFQNAYLATVDDPYILLPEVSVLPSTALSSKNRAGFKPKYNGVFDSLIDSFCAESYGRLYDPNCPTDGSLVHAFASFYGKVKSRNENKNEHQYFKTSTNNRLLTRVGINRRRSVSEEQILYSIEVLNESQEYKNKPIIYRSSIFVDDNIANSLQNFIQVNTSNFRLGGSASRGLGNTKITASEPIELESNLVNRVNRFNKKLKKRWNEWQVFGNVNEDILSNRKCFTLDLQSDAILTEQWMRTTIISAEMLKKFTDIQDSSLKLHVTNSSYDYRSGWNAAWGLMKDVEMVTNKGAVYLFSVSSDRFEEWAKALEDLEIRGVGDRTSEGFGQVQICNDFHLVLREEAV